MDTPNHTGLYRIIMITENRIAIQGAHTQMGHAEVPGKMHPYSSYNSYTLQLQTNVMAINVLCVKWG